MMIDPSSSSGEEEDEFCRHHLFFRSVRPCAFHFADSEFISAYDIFIPKAALFIAGMTSLSDSERVSRNHNPDSRRGSWTALKCFLKDTKRRTVQKVVSLSNNYASELATGVEEKDWQEQKNNFKEFSTAVTEIRKELVSVQIAVAKLSLAFSQLTESLTKIPEPDSYHHLEAIQKQNLVSSSRQNGEKLSEIVENARLELKKKIDFLQQVKYIGKQRDQFFTDLLSYERRLNTFQSKGDNKNVEKFSEKKRKAKKLLIRKDFEARQQFTNIQNQRGEYIQSEIGDVFRAASKYFAEMADACSSGLDLKKTRVMTEGKKVATDKTDGPKHPVQSKPKIFCVAPTPLVTSEDTAITKNTNYPLRAHPADGESSEPLENCIRVGSIVVGIHEFKPQEEDELGFKAGEKLKVI